MLRKALTLGMVFILALSLLAVSMITCFTYDAQADGGHHGPHWDCNHREGGHFHIFHHDPGADVWDCTWRTQ